MIKLPKYKTIEIKTFEFSPKYSGDPFSERDEFIEEFKNVQRNIWTYALDKVGESFDIREYPTRMTVKSDDGERIYFHVSRVYYSVCNTRRVLVSKDDLNGDVLTVFQIAIE